MYADEKGEETFVMPWVGPEMGDCKTEMFASRGSPDMAKLFYSKVLGRLAGLGIIYNDREIPFVALGKPSTQETASIDTNET